LIPSPRQTREKKGEFRRECEQKGAGEEEGGGNLQLDAHWKREIKEKGEER